MKSESCTGEKCEIDNKFRVVCCTGKFAESLGYQGDVVNKRLFFGGEMERALRESGKYSGFTVVLGANEIVYYAVVDIEAVDGGYIVKNMRIESVVNIDFWERMFRKMPLPVMILSKNHTIVDLNDEMLKLVGKEREELLGTKCHVLMHAMSHPPDGCPLLNAVENNMEHNLNMMDTVLGEFLISVVKIDDNLYAHYAIKEVALLMDMQNRMMDFLKRYNRILIAATVINEEMLAGRDIDDIIRNIGEKIRDIEGFHGAAIFTYRDGEWRSCFSFNVSVSPDEIVNALDGKKVILVTQKGVNYYGFTTYNLSRKVLFILNMGKEHLSDDELNTIISSIDHLGEYIVSKILEEKRDMAYKYISDVMSDFATLVDRIRNPLATLSLSVEMEVEDDELKKVMLDKISEIQDITKKIDELWNRAESMQKVLKGE